MEEEYRQTLIRELKNQYNSPIVEKDIIIIVHNQFDCVKKCLDSIIANTKNYRLFIWDNGSDEETKSLLVNYNPFVLIRNETNVGFVKPNNYLAALTDSPYIILLNSDTIVSSGWDDALIGAFEKDIGIVGYSGRLLNEHGEGESVVYGENIDYVEGWCMCLPRHVYNKFGLFDDHFQFAYCEDSDLCLKVKTNGYKLYALSLKYVKHVGGVTTRVVQSKMTDFNLLFSANHAYLKDKWKNYLKFERVKYGKT